MTTTPELHKLAKDPQAFDTTLARLTAERDKAAAEVTQATDRLHELAGDRKRYRNTRVPVWGLSDLEAERLAKRAAVHGDQSARVVLASRAAAQLMGDAITDEMIRMDNAYTGWTRFFPSVTKSQPHIHRSLSCRTLYPTTVMTWAPELSGRTDAEAVAELDEALCTVCFPDAPVALHNHVSKRSQAEKDARAAEKAAKELTAEESQSFGEGSGRTVYGNDRIKTVAACKDLIRKAVDEEVELEWFRSLKPGQRPGWNAESLARRVSVLTDNLVKHRADAAQAALVLVHREQAHEGWGMTAEAIAEMKARKLRNARKEWAKL